MIGWAMIGWASVKIFDFWLELRSCEVEIFYISDSDSDSDNKIEYFLHKDDKQQQQQQQHTWLSVSGLVNNMILLQLYLVLVISACVRFCF